MKEFYDERKVNTNDIMWFMNESFLNNDYSGQVLEAKKIIIERELKRYLINKIANAGIASNLKELLSKDIPTLVDMLCSCSKDKNKQISNIINFLLNVLMEFQNYVFEWEIGDTNKGFITNNNIIVKYVTDKNTDYMEIFKEVYNYYKRYVLNPIPSRIR